MRYQVPGIAWILASCLVASGCDFPDLKQDLDKIVAQAHEYQGRVIAEGADVRGLVVVAISDLDGRELSAFRVVANPGPYRLVTTARATYLFAFEDKNLDFRFQADEKYGWAESGEMLEVDDHGQREIDIIIGSAAGPPPPRQLLNRPLIDNLYGNHDFHFGTVTPLEDDLLSLAQAKKGMWQPFSFLEDGGTGIHFMEPYDPDKIPVLFVHGALGAPLNFAALIETLDRARFQPWYVSYPSGMDMQTIAGGLVQFIEIVQRNYHFNELHIVAHSMGGLVARGAINICQGAGACGYIRSLTSISTPWDGVESARSGVAWAPAVVPVWRDLDPDSDYVKRLFDTPLAEGLPYHLLFGYRQNGLFPNESGDGVIALSSQLREVAQASADLVRGYNEGHVSILANEDVGKLLNQLLSREEAQK